MVIDRAPGGTNLVEVLDRVLDKGIVIDAWIQLSLVGIDLVTVEARVVVASIATYMERGEVVTASSLAWGLAANGRSPSSAPTTHAPSRPFRPAMTTENGGLPSKTSTH
jgi:hypothetical protein